MILDNLLYNGDKAKRGHFPCWQLAALLVGKGFDVAANDWCSCLREIETMTNYPARFMSQKENVIIVNLPPHFYNSPAVLNKKLWCPGQVVIDLSAVWQGRVPVFDEHGVVYISKDTLANIQ